MDTEAAVGVPVISPVVVLKERPLGKAGVMANESALFVRVGEFVAIAVFVS